MNSYFTKKIGSVFLLTTLLSAGTFAKENYIVIKEISSAKALRIAQQAVIHCASLGHTVTATVVD